jgi:Mg-chelatase subunit ChlD
MAFSGKMQRAKAALKAALRELDSGDSFNIMDFSAQPRLFSSAMMAPTAENLERANGYIDRILAASTTNLSAALDRALVLKPLTHIFVLSDGEPSQGIRDFQELRTHVRRLNRANAQFITLALGLGEQFPGIRLLQGLAEDSGGHFTYINLK